MKAAVVIPVKDDAERLAWAVSSFLPGLPDNGLVIIVDDGSHQPVSESVAMAGVCADKRVMVIRHHQCRGPGAARNSALAAASKLAAELIILLDADCLADPDFVLRHIELHERAAGVACFGGAIRGQGRGFWAWLDGRASWFTSWPGGHAHAVFPPYHLPTTNLSFPASLDLRFDESLRTGEDVAFVGEMRQQGVQLQFSPSPVVGHHDRETFRAMLRHQYRWGMHTYTVRFRERSLFSFRRLGFILVFAALAPVYASAATTLNLLPLLKISWRHVMAMPFLFFIYCVKAIAVVHGAIIPNAARFPDTVDEM